MNYRKNVDRFRQEQPLHTTYSFVAMAFFFVLVSIPVGYGSALYDIPLHEVQALECNDIQMLETPKDGYHFMYLLGHTSGREIFCYATIEPKQLVLVDSKEIKSITVKYENNPHMSIRGWHKILSQEIISTSDLQEVEPQEQENWLKGEL